MRTKYIVSAALGLESLHLPFFYTTISGLTWEASTGLTVNFSPPVLQEVSQVGRYLCIPLQGWSDRMCRDILFWLYFTIDFLLIFLVYFTILLLRSSILNLFLLLLLCSSSAALQASLAWKYCEEEDSSSYKKDNFPQHLADCIAQIYGYALALSQKVIISKEFELCSKCTARA